MVLLVVTAFTSEVVSRIHDCGVTKELFFAALGLEVGRPGIEARRTHIGGKKIPQKTNYHIYAVS